MSAEPEIVTRAGQPYVAVRARVTMAGLGGLGERLGEVFGWLGARGLAPAGAPFFRYDVIDMTRELVASKVIVVTGAARGIGRALALGLAAEGARVAVLARERKQAQLVVDEIGEIAGARPALALEADVADEAAVTGAAVTGAAAEVDAAWGRVDALINNAGWMPGRQPVLELELPVLERVLRSNLIGSFLATKHFAPLIIRGGGGRIVYLSSVIGSQPGPGAAPYGGAKAAINILANVVHAELADEGIRTVAIAPGLTDTPGMRAIVGEEYIARVAGQYPGGRVGQPEDIVALTAFLCSDAASHLSGTVITVRPPVYR